MKKLFFILILILITIPVFSQDGMSVRYLEVYNETECEQYFVVYSGDECPCYQVNLPYQSNLITVAPFSFTTLDSSVLASIGDGGITTYSGESHEFISGARIIGYHLFENECPNDSGCTVSQPYCGAIYPFDTCVVDTIYPNCEKCLITTATWYLDDCGGTAKLVFTP